MERYCLLMLSIISSQTKVNVALYLYAVAQWSKLESYTMKMMCLCVQTFLVET